MTKHYTSNPAKVVTSKQKELFMHLSIATQMLDIELCTKIDT